MLISELRTIVVVIGGAMRDRTADLLRARQALSQLSYGPILTVLFCLYLRQPSHSLSHIHEYVPALALAASSI